MITCLSSQYLIIPPQGEILLSSSHSTLPSGHQPTLEHPEIEDNTYSEDLYNRIDAFLDGEGLFIALPTPASSDSKFVPLISLKKFALRTFSRQASESDSDGSPISNCSDEDNEVLPMLIARRRSSELFSSQQQQQPKRFFKSQFSLLKTVETLEP